MKDLASIVWSKDNTGDGVAPGFFIVDANPDGLLEAPSSSIAANPTSGALYIKTETNATSWSAVSGSAASQTGRLIGFQVLTGSGTYVPTTGATAAYVTPVGAGAGAGGVPVAAGELQSTATVSSGGGGGAWASKYIAVLAASYAFAVGTRGTGGAIGSNPGVNGGTTTFGSPAVLTAPGGTASLAGAASGTMGGLGGALATGGDTNTKGMKGWPAVSGFTRASGAGGSTPWGTGGGATNAAGGATASGEAGSGYGSGGGGAYSATASAGAAGGDGADGVILVWEYS